MSFLSRIFGSQPPVSEETRQAILSYRDQEWQIRGIQDDEAALYNQTLTKYGGSIEPGSDALKEVIAASKRQADAFTNIIRRHLAIKAIPDEAGACFAAWEMSLLHLQIWASGMVAVYEGMDAGSVPAMAHVTEARGEEEKARQQAIKEESRLLKRIKISAQEGATLLSEAEEKVRRESESTQTTEAPTPRSPSPGSHGQTDNTE